MHSRNGWGGRQRGRGGRRAGLGARRWRAELGTGRGRAGLGARWRAGLGARRWRAGLGTGRGRAGLGARWRAGLGARRWRAGVEARRWRAELGARRRWAGSGARRWGAGLGSRRGRVGFGARRWRAGSGARRWRAGLGARRWRVGFGARRWRRCMRVGRPEERQRWLGPGAGWPRLGRWRWGARPWRRRLRERRCFPHQQRRGVGLAVQLGPSQAEAGGAGPGGTQVAGGAAGAALQGGGCRNGGSDWALICSTNTCTEEPDAQEACKLGAQQVACGCRQLSKQHRPAADEHPASSGALACVRMWKRLRLPATCSSTHSALAPMDTAVAAQALGADRKLRAAHSASRPGSCGQRVGAGSLNARQTQEPAGAQPALRQFMARPSSAAAAAGGPTGGASASARQRAHRGTAPSLARVHAASPPAARRPPPPAQRGRRCRPPGATWYALRPRSQTQGHPRRRCMQRRADASAAGHLQHGSLCACISRGPRAAWAGAAANEQSGNSAGCRISARPCRFARHPYL
jgi:hypothetical protein